jgi:hypothetical protein
MLFLATGALLLVYSCYSQLFVILFCGWNIHYMLSALWFRISYMRSPFAAFCWKGGGTSVWRSRRQARGRRQGENEGGGRRQMAARDGGRRKNLVSSDLCLRQERAARRKAGMRCSPCWRAQKLFSYGSVSLYLAATVLA